MSYLSDFKEFDEGYVAFRGGAKGRRITGKGTLKTGKLDFEDVYFVKELQFNLFSVSQMCDKNNSVLFTNIGCFVMSPDFKLSDESQVLLKVPRKNNMYSVDMKNIFPKESLTCLVAKATLDESIFTWVFFLESQEETSDILKSFITQIENLVDKKVKIIRCDNGTEFKNRIMKVEHLLNTLDHFGKFDGKSDDGFFVGYSLNSKAFRVYNIRTRKVEENLHVRFLEDKPIIVGDGPKWLFDIDVLSKSMNYVPVVACTNTNDFIGTKESIGAGHSSEEPGSSQDYILMPLWNDGSPFDSSSKDASNDEPQPSNDAGKKDAEGGINDQERTENSAQDVNTIGQSINTTSINFNTSSLNVNTVSPTVPTAPLQSTYVDFFGDESELDLSNITTTYLVPTTPNIRIHKDHSLDHVLGDVLFGEEPKKTLEDLPYGKRANGTKWVYRNKKDERVARIEAIRLFLAYASFKYFVRYQMDVMSSFLYVKIEEEVYVCQHPGFEDPEFPDKVYKRGQVYVDDIIFGSTKKELCTDFEKLMHKKFQMSSIGELTFFLGLQVKQKDNGIFISQDKYVDEILKKFEFSTVKIASTPMETSKPLLKDAEAEDVDVHLYRSMIGSLIYLIAFRPDIMFVVCACARFQVTPKVSHLHAVKRIFRYLKGQPKLGLWYPKDSPFDLEAYTDSDYAGVSLDRKSTTGGCQFHGRILISWQCKKQTIVANSTTEAEYVAAAS
ncbi:putative ribonuclease H-like domain-containing protein [Tanacetum coccineum]|uniref:Ribonuclease H-like domain-containing protein n=1 Tax=Tanacetum coccineum TaxID=301880 RepID=A0ABQ4XPD0_9ASTR